MDDRIKKEMYEARNNYVEKKNRGNRELLEDKLTDEQIDYIETVCSMRHTIHTNRESLFNSEAPNQDVWNFIEELEENIEKLNLPKINNLLRIEEYITDIDVYELGEDYEKSYSEFCEQIEELNAKIEKWLKEIDDEYKTNYCPSGKYRYIEETSKDKKKADEEEM